MNQDPDPDWPDLQEQRLRIEAEVGRREKALSSEDPERILELAKLEYLTGEIQAAKDHFQLVSEVSEDVGSQAIALLGLAWVEYTQSHWTDSEDLVREALDRLPPVASKARLLALRSLLAYRRGRYGNSQRDAEAVLQMDPESKAAGLAHSNLGIVLHAMDRGPEALEHWEQALKLARELNYPELAVRALNNRGTLYYTEKQYPQAMEEFNLAIQVGRKAHNLVYLGYPYLNLGGTHLALDEYQEGMEQLKEAGELFNRVGNVMMLGSVHIERGRLYRLRRDHKRGWHCLDKALSLSQTSESLRNLALTYRERGLLHGDQRRWPEAVADLRLARELAVLLKDRVQQLEIDGLLKKLKEQS